MNSKDLDKTDRTIAEKVMGWKVKGYRLVVGGPKREVPEKEADRAFYYEGNRRRFAVYNWHPTRNISQAFKVRDKVETLRFSKRMRFMKALQRIVSDYVSEIDTIEGDMDKRPTLHGLAIILYVQPIHICLAAVECVEGGE